MALKVIGAGLGRTGTSSLKLAFERYLGFKGCYHMGEVGEAQPLWVAAANGKPDWERIFDGYDSTTDYPACLFWRELADFYPDAKVLLSVRDADKWFDSTQATIFSPDMMALGSKAPEIQKEFFDKCCFAGIKEHIHERGFMVTHFHRHRAEIERTIPKERLLVYDVKEGWEPLCAFLGVPVPGEPFPHANTTDDLQPRLKFWRELTETLAETYPNLTQEDWVVVRDALRKAEQAQPPPGFDRLKALAFAKAEELRARKRA